METEHVVLIGGRSGVGKTTAATGMHEILAGLDVHHAFIEGDYLDQAHPAPHEAHPDARLAERNLAAMWAHYRELGYRRLILTNTVAPLFADSLVSAMGGTPTVVRVVLRGDDDTVARRLTDRAIGPASTAELAHSARMARWIDETTDAGIHRIDTDGLSPRDVATRLVELSGWARDAD